MANSAIHQQPFTANREDGDVFMIDRGTSTLKLQGSNMAPAYIVVQTLIDSADVLQLNTTPYVVVPPVAAGKVAVLIAGIIEFSGGSADYATNTELVLGPTSAITDSYYTLYGNIADRSAPNRLTNPAQATLSPMVAGDSVSAYVLNGDPATGDSDITITTIYYLATI